MNNSLKTMKIDLIYIMSFAYNEHIYYETLFVDKITLCIMKTLLCDMKIHLISARKYLNVFHFLPSSILLFF